MIPDYIRSSDPDSFGHYTICSRFPRIIDDIIDNNKLPAIQHRLKALGGVLADLKIKKLTPQKNTDFELFNTSIEPFLNQSIFDAPFFTAEMFFYQLLAHELDYYTNGHDYFSTLKQKSLADAIRFITGKPDFLFPENWDAATAHAMAQSLRFALWGNLADLSLFTLSKSRQETSFSEERLLIDHSKEFTSFFQSYKGTVHIFLDNAGYELVSDLYLMAVLLSNPHCKIRAHVKPMPMFVSDVTRNDWQLTLASIGDLSEAPIRNWYSILGSALADHRISLTTDHFWSSAYYFSDYWLNRLDINANELIVCKGDLNYRRFFEDRTWPNTTPTEAAVTTSMAPILFLRTLKSEMMTGLSPSTIQQLHITEPDWMISGNYGIIQFLKK